MTTAKASIIITNYNYGQFIARCIESALNQDYPDTEIVVVDDASTDGSRDIILGYKGRVIPVLQQKNSGQGAAFNAGFNACTGDVVFFLDADDWLYRDAVARVVEVMTPATAQVQFRLHLVDSAGRQIDLLPPPDVRFDDGDVLPILIKKGRFECTVTSGNAFNRSTLKSVLPVPEEKFRISADGYLVTIAPFCGTVVSIEEPLGAYVVHGANNWTGGFGGTLDPVRFRRAVSHDCDRYEALRGRAAQHGLTLADDPGLADTQHLMNRIGSLILAPSKHPIPGDSRPLLGLHGAWASRHANLPARMRALLAVWFLSLGMLPRSWANKSLSWRFDPATRPQGLRRLMALLKRKRAEQDCAN